MQTEFTLFEVPMVPEGGSALTHPPMRCVFDEPGVGWLAKAWVRHRSSGAASLCILWADGPEPVDRLVAADLPVTADRGKMVEVAA